MATFNDIRDQLPYIITRCHKTMNRLLEIHETLDPPHMVSDLERLQLFSKLNLAECDAGTIHDSLSRIIKDFPQGR